MVSHAPFLSRAGQRGWLALALALAAIISPAAAQDEGATPDGESEILVSASAEELNRARSYINALQVTALNQQAARWADPICIGVTGASRPIAERLAGRINAAARQIGARLGEAGCKPNLLVAFSPDASAFVAQVQRQSPERLREIPKRREGFVFGKSAAVRWWYTTEVTGSDGRPLTAGGTGLVACAGPCALPSLGQNVKSQNTYASSIVRAPSVRRITSAVVVIDVPLAAGRAIDSLGDYAALVSLAEIWPQEGAVPQGSILGLFAARPEPAENPPLLGAMDRRFLCELYRLPLDRSGLYHRGALQRAVSLPQERCFTSEANP